MSDYEGGYTPDHAPINPRPPQGGSVFTQPRPDRKPEALEMSLRYAMAQCIDMLPDTPEEIIARAKKFAAYLEGR